MEKLCRSGNLLLESCELGCDLPIAGCGKSVEIAGKFLKQQRGSDLKKMRKILRKKWLGGDFFGKNRLIPHKIRDTP